MCRFLFACRSINRERDSGKVLQEKCLCVPCLLCSLGPNCDAEIDS